MTRKRLLELLELLLPAHSPGGDEGEVDAILWPYFREYTESPAQDGAENLYGKISGTGERPPILIAAHKDELGMIVKRIEPDGSLRVQELGGVHAWKYGEGLVDILAASGVLTGVMGVGSMHSTEETPRVHYSRENPMDWTVVRVQTRRTAAQLEALGVYPGTRVVLHRSRKHPTVWHDCVCAFALDDKAAVALMLETMRALAAGPPPPQDIYFAATAIEEQMCGGAAALAGKLEVDTMLALEIGPVEPEYGLELDDRPIVWYKDRIGTYTKSFCDEIAALSLSLGLGIQRAVYSRASSDATGSRLAGQVGRISVLSFPVLNSHGFEVAPIDGILKMQQLLLAYLRGERG